MNYTRHQLKAARALLDLEQADLAAGAGVSRASIGRIESGQVQNPNTDTIKKIDDFLKRSGIEFLDYDGVRKNRTYVQRLEGQSGIRAFYDDVYAVAQETGGDFTIFNGMPSDLIKWAGEDWYKMHAKRMTEAKAKYHFRVIVEHGETNLIGKDFVTYKWFPKEEFHPHTIYTYGDRVAFLTFEETVRIMVVREKQMAESHRALFNRVWEYAKDIPENVYKL